MQVPGATTLSAKLRQRRGEPAAVWAFTNRLGGERFEYTPASAGLRLVAGLTDLAVLLLLLALLAPGVEEVFRNLLTHDPYAGMVVAGMAWGVGLLGLTTSYGLRGQTPGQWWWGLMICRMDGREVWFGRAFVVACATLLTGWMSPLVAALLPGWRTPADWLAGVRVVRTRLVSES